MVRCRQSLALGKLQSPHRSLNQSPEPPPTTTAAGDPSRIAVRAPAPASPNTHGVLAAGGAAQFLRPAARRLRPVAAPPQLSRPSRPPPRSRSGASSPGGAACRAAGLPPRPSAPPQPSVRRRFAAAWPSVLTPLPPAPLAARQQDAADKEDAGRQAQAEPPHPAVDPHAHGQPDPVQREAPALAPHEDRPLDYSLRERS